MNPDIEDLIQKYSLSDEVRTDLYKILVDYEKVIYCSKIISDCKRCRNRIKQGEIYCEIHKENKPDCRAYNLSTKMQCPNVGTVQPEGSRFFYCKTHSKKWETFENKN